MWSCKCFPHVSKMLILTYKQDNIEEGTNQIVLTKRKKWSLMSDITVIRDEAYCPHPVIYHTYDIHGGFKFVSWTQIPTFTEIMWSCKCFPHVSKMLILTYKRASDLS
jgi:hypothetical protein